MVCESVWPTTNKSRCHIIKMYWRLLRTIFVALNQNPNAMDIYAISGVFKTVNRMHAWTTKKNSKINLLCFIFCGRIHAIFPFSTPASDTFNSTKMNCTRTHHACTVHTDFILDRFRLVWMCSFAMCVFTRFVCHQIDFHVDPVSATLNRNIMWIKCSGPVCVYGAVWFNWIQSCLMPG